MPLGRKRQQRVQSLIEELEVLQTSTVVPMRILHLRRSKSAGVADFASLVEMDPCLCTKVLSLANSAWFAPAQPVTRVAPAIAMIGLNNLLPLLFGASLAGVFNKLGLPPSENRELWKSSLLKAIAAREFVAWKEGAYADEAFICGLLQDVALPVMYAADPASWSNVQSALSREPGERAEMEQRLFASDHGSLGQRLVKRMGMPMLYVAATGAHHDPEKLRKMVKEPVLCEAMEFAASMPHRMSEWHRMRSDRLRRSLCAEGGNRQDDPLVQLLQRIDQRYQEIQVMLGEHDSESHAFRVFLQEVSSEIAHSIETTIGESATTITRLRTRETAMLKRMKGLEQQARESDYDPLTRIFNRRGFVSSMGRILVVAKEYQFGCGVGYLDLDDFKQANDTHGHAVGDAVLKAVAEMLRKAVADHGSVGRIGGDEFVFVTVATEQKGGVSVAERISAGLGELLVPVPGGDPVRVGGSVGMLWANAPVRHTADDLLHQADGLMYQAKKSGKGGLLIGQASDLLEDAAAGVTTSAAA